MLNGYQRTAILRSGIELGLFTAIGREGATSADLAARCGAAPRGVRILCDVLVTHDLLERLESAGDGPGDGGAYRLVEDSAADWVDGSFMG